MEQDAEKIAETEWRVAFRDRIIQARGERTQETMAYLLGISQSAYSKYEGQRLSQMPVRLLPRFCKICAVSIEWLIDGETAAKPARQPKPKAKKPKTRKAA